MIYKVLDILSVGNNTSVTISGKGDGLKNGVMITTPDGKRFKLLSIGMLAGVSGNINETTILVQGKFSSNTFTIK